jgi:adenylate cyclase
MTIDAQKLAALASWLTDGAPPQDDFTETLAEFSRRLAETGVDFGTLEIFRIAINPLVLGKIESWTPRGGVRQMLFPHAQARGPFYVGSLAEACYNKRLTIRWRIGVDREWEDHPMARLVIERKYTEYAMFPLLAMHEPDAGLGVGTKRRGGFTANEIAVMQRLAVPLARVVEAQTQRENTETLLETYLGRESGFRVLSGGVTRGDAEIIPAVILFADLAGFTALSNANPPREVVAVLNRFFDALDKPIRAEGGEILKMIGDGVLAIFPAQDAETARRAAPGALAAMDAARETLNGAPIDFRVALHLGDIHYGNIGSETRLDFTAIGPAVKLAARMLGAAAEMGADTVCSADFAALAQDRAAPLGEFDFKGFDGSTRVFAVP